MGECEIGNNGIVIADRVFNGLVLLQLQLWAVKYIINPQPGNGRIKSWPPSVTRTEEGIVEVAFGFPVNPGSGDRIEVSSEDNGQLYPLGECP